MITKDESRWLLQNHHLYICITMLYVLLKYHQHMCFILSKRFSIVQFYIHYCDNFFFINSNNKDTSPIRNKIFDSTRRDIWNYDVSEVMWKQSIRYIEWIAIIAEFGATTAPQNAAKTLLNRYDVERASIAWHVTEFASRRVSCINYLTVWRVCTQQLWKKNRPEITRVTVPRSERDQKTQRVFSNQRRKVRYSHVFVESANTILVPRMKVRKHEMTSVEDH